ncbi:hypothetical protein RIF29_25472 [Crotalaria pallida]|uniref:Uncharacterized protein n=1 Tax=Crotalaria pallida TaxID=3830 RepID=A0AAN9EM85_CROPI
MYINHAVSQPNVIHPLPPTETVGHEDDVEHPYEGVDGMGLCDANAEVLNTMNDTHVEVMEDVNDANVSGVQEVNGAANLEEGNQNANEVEEVEKGVENIQEGSEGEDSALNFRFNDSDDEEGDEGYFDNVGVAAPTGETLAGDSEHIDDVVTAQNAEVENRVETEQRPEADTEQRAEPDTEERVQADSEQRVVNEGKGKKRKKTTAEGSGSEKKKRGRPRKNRVVHNELSIDPSHSDFDKSRESDNDSFNFSGGEGDHPPPLFHGLSDEEISDEELDSGPGSDEDEASNPTQTQMSNNNHSVKGRAATTSASHGGSAKGKSTNLTQTDNVKSKAVTQKASQGQSGKAALSRKDAHVAKDKGKAIQEGDVSQQPKGKATEKFTRPKTVCTRSDTKGATTTTQSAQVQSNNRQKLTIIRPWK